MARGTDKDDAFYFPEEQLYAIAKYVPEHSKNLIQPHKPYAATPSSIIMGMHHYALRLEHGGMYSVRQYASTVLDGRNWTIVKESDLTPEQRRMAGLPTEDTTIAELRERIEALEARVPVEEKPDENGWIRWRGGECPVKEGTRVDVWFRNGRGALNVPALQPVRGYCAELWDHRHADGDIVAYRLAAPAPKSCEP